MTQTIFKERLERLKEVNEVLKQIDVTIRPAAFSLLQDYITQNKSVGDGKPSMQKTRESEGIPDRTEFFSQFTHDKPADNVLLLAAYHYSEYGTASFTVDQMKDLGNEVGVTIPERLDMTFLQAKRDGKALFLRAGRGAFRPTVHGETFFKKSYQVSKGTQQKQEADE
ncbi:MAG TPA: hypothetical protein VGN23_12245 [Verrucomicrobiae bacterium]|jgi:hypothetical protein